MGVVNNIVVTSHYTFYLPLRANTKYQIAIDSMLEVPTHLTTMFDWINTSEMVYLMGEMCIEENPEANIYDSRINT